jgi:hypothetical protein
VNNSAAGVREVRTVGARNAIVVSAVPPAPASRRPSAAAKLH